MEASTGLQRQIEEHLDGVVLPALQRIGGSSAAEQAWRTRYLTDERVRLETFATAHGEFLPASTLGVQQWGGTDQQGNLRSSLFDFWEPTCSCGDESRVPPSILGDGPKWLCGAGTHQHCNVLSVGSNFDASFERGMHAAVRGCPGKLLPSAPALSSLTCACQPN